MMNRRAKRARYTSDKTKSPSVSWGFLLMRSDIYFSPLALCFLICKTQYISPLAITNMKTRFT